MVKAKLLSFMASCRTVSDIYMSTILLPTLFHPHPIWPFIFFAETHWFLTEWFFGLRLYYISFETNSGLVSWIVFCLFLFLQVIISLTVYNSHLLFENTEEPLHGRLSWLNYLNRDVFVLVQKVTESWGRIMCLIIAHWLTNYYS